MIIRRAVCGDFDALGRVMFDAVHADPSPYSPAQRDAWLAAPLSGADWQARLAGQYGVVAEQDTLTGFMTLRPDGYIDLAFVLPVARGTGLFRKLYAPIEGQAKTLGLGRLWTDASLMAQPAFAALGFGVLQHEVIEHGGQPLARARMEKRL
jgi:putative acetyltransferase